MIGKIEKAPSDCSPQIVKFPAFMDDGAFSKSSQNPIFFFNLMLRGRKLDDPCREFIIVCYQFTISKFQYKKSNLRVRKWDLKKVPTSSVSVSGKASNLAFVTGGK
jgi:hypothetical protein